MFYSQKVNSFHEVRLVKKQRNAADVNRSRFALLEELELLEKLDRLELLEKLKELEGQITN